VQVVESHYTHLLEEKIKEIEFERKRANALDTKLQSILEKLNWSQDELTSTEQQVAILQKECLSKEEDISALKTQVKRHCVAIEALRSDRTRDAEHYLEKISCLNSKLESVSFHNTITSEETGITLTPRNFHCTVPPDSMIAVAQPAAKELCFIAPESQIAEELNNLNTLIYTKFTKLEQESHSIKELFRSAKSLIAFPTKTRISPEISRCPNTTLLLQWGSWTICCLVIGVMLPVCIQLMSYRSNRFELS